MFVVPSFFGFQDAGKIVLDPDAAAFVARVNAAGGSLTSTEISAVNQLVLDLKANSLWTPIKAIYPMVGASAAACAQNLKSSSFTGTFTSGWTFASTGVTPNGTSAYFDTTLNSNTQLSYLSASISVYVRTSTMLTGFPVDMGNAATGYTPLMQIESNGTGTARSQYCWDFTAGRGAASITTTNASGMWGVSRTSSSTWVSFERNTSVSKTTTTTVSSLPNFNLFIGATNLLGSATQYSSREISFSHIGDGLTSSEFTNFYTAVQAFQTTLSRQV